MAIHLPLIEVEVFLPKRDKHHNVKEEEGLKILKTYEELINCLLEDLDQIHYNNYNIDNKDKKRIGVEAFLMLANVGKWVSTWMVEIMKD